jgi:hypothetical protein
LFLTFVIEFSVDPALFTIRAGFTDTDSGID